MDGAGFVSPSRPSFMPLAAVVIAGLFLIYRLATAFDFSMSMLVGEAFYRQSGMNDAHIFYFLTLPVWVISAWSVAIWCGLAGAVAVFLKPAIALPLLLISLLGAIGYAMYTLVLSNGREALGIIWFMPLANVVYTLMMISIVHRYVIRHPATTSLI